MRTCFWVSASSLHLQHFPANISKCQLKWPESSLQNSGNCWGRPRPAEIIGRQEAGGVGKEAAAGVQTANFVFLKLSFMKWQIPLRANLKLFTSFCFFEFVCSSTRDGKFVSKGLHTFSYTPMVHRECCPLAGKYDHESASFSPPIQRQPSAQLACDGRSISFLQHVLHPHLVSLGGGNITVCWPLYARCCFIVTRPAPAELWSGPRPACFTHQESFRAKLSARNKEAVHCFVYKIP